MENKQTGWLITGIGVAVLAIIFLFNSAMKKIVEQTCDHGSTCTMYDTLTTQTWISVIVALIILVMGFVIMFSKPEERIVVKKVEIKPKKKVLDLKGLDKDEKAVINYVQEEGNAVFQATLMEKMEIGKVKMTRLLDKLEAKQFIERKRRGKNNIVVLRD